MSTNLELYKKVTGDIVGKKNLIEAKQVIESFVLKGVITPKLDIVYSERDDSYMLITIDETMKISKNIAYNYLRKAYGGKVELKKMINLLPYNLLTYDPIKPKYYTSGLIDCYNTFYAPNITQHLNKPKHEEIKLLDHIKLLLDNVFPVPLEQKFFIHWLANAFQLNKNQTTIISFNRVEGTGKGILFDEIVEYAFGAKNIATVGQDILSAPHNGELENTSFCLINELEDKENASIDKFKKWVTDSTIEVKAKFRTPRNIKNILNFWVHSNRDEALQVSSSDRRLNFFKTTAKPIIDIMKYDKLVGEIRAERDHFIEMLCTLKVDRDFLSKPIKNKEKELIVVQQSRIEDRQQADILNGELEDLFLRLESAITTVSDSNGRQSTYNILGRYGDLNGMFKQLEKEIQSGYIAVSLLAHLYTLESGDFKASGRSVGLKLTPIWGKTVNKRFNGKQRSAKTCLI